MGKYRLDDMEADEVYHALCDRKELLEKRKKDLLEKDGLAEASEAVDVRLRLYITDGDSVGLIRLFAPQRDAFAQRERERQQKRDANGGADLFGGGVETGGGHPANETIKAAYDNAKPGDQVVVGVAIMKADAQPPAPASSDDDVHDDVSDVTPIAGKRQRRLGSGPKRIGPGNPTDAPPDPPRPLA